jgi:hypothetical protein
MPLILLGVVLSAVIMMMGMPDVMELPLSVWQTW